MRFSLLISFLLLPFIVFSQSVDSLEKEIQQINKKSKSLNLKIDSLKKEVSILEEEKTELQQLIYDTQKEKELNNSVSAKVSALGGKLRDKPSPSGKVLFELEGGDEVSILDLAQNPYLRVSYKNTEGYLSYGSLKSSNYLEGIVQEMKKQEKAREEFREQNPGLAKLIRIYGEEEAKRLKEENPKLADIVIRFGKKDAKKLLYGDIWIGMSAGKARYVLGEPEDINRTTTKYGTREQWVYPNGEYYYFEDGKLTSWQD